MRLTEIKTYLKGIKEALDKQKASAPLLVVSRGEVGRDFMTYRCSGTTEPSWTCGAKDAEKFCADAKGSLVYWYGHFTDRMQGTTWHNFAADFVACRLF